ncbi:MAG TPA: 50S ribosomal protein L4 [Candidatus Bathyarchaeia archaeon]|nr:50S ribosomal protein L4 [Candidatus Bathyarchaeia archaeon]
MPEVDIYASDGQKKGKLNLPREIFAAKVNSVLLAQAVRVFLSNQRCAKAKVKTRGEVAGSGKKIWRQKGTGRARHGDQYAPIFVGGGVAHGPTGRENYSLKLSRRMRREALFSALTAKLKADEILVVEGLEKIKPKTKEIDQLFKKILGKKKKISLVLPGVLDNLVRGSRNIGKIRLVQANLLNAYQVLNGGSLVLLPESIQVIEKTFLKDKSSGKAKITRPKKKLKENES